MPGWRTKPPCYKSCDCGLCLWAFCCTQCVYAQLVSIALKLPSRTGNVKQWSTSGSSICCGAFLFIAVCNLIGYLLFMVPSLYVTVFAVAFSSVATIVLCCVRQRFREALNIQDPAVCCGSEGCEDCCCAAWCGPCTAMHLFWHVNVSTSRERKALSAADPADKYQYKRIAYSTPCDTNIADEVKIEPGTRDGLGAPRTVDATMEMPSTPMLAMAV